MMFCRCCRHVCTRRVDNILLMVGRAKVLDMFDVLLLNYRDDLDMLTVVML